MPNHPGTRSQADRLVLWPQTNRYLQASATGNTLRTSHIKLVFKRSVSWLGIGQTLCAKDDSHTRGFPGAHRAIGFRYRCRQRLEPPGLERRRAMPVLPPGSPDPCTVSRRAVGVPAEAGCFLTAAARRGSSHGPCFFADLATRASFGLVFSPQRFLLPALFVLKFN
jgi:hypothetical protein